MTMAVVSPTAKTLFTMGNKGFSFTDSPINRGF